MTASPAGRAPFGTRLAEAGERYGRLCVGIDPHPGLLDAWGLTRDVHGLARFTAICVEAFAGEVALVKPQVAFFEAYGSAGFAVLERAIADLADAGTLVCADAKRGDIGSTMDAYARAWLSDESPLACDCVTISPYLGVGALAPALDLAESTGRGAFVLARTSNPEGGTVQEARVDDRSVAQSIVDEVAAHNRRHAPGRPGSVGVVVGATLAVAPDLDDLGGPVLMPGVGAQGASAVDVERLAGAVRGPVFPNISREILRVGPDVAALRNAARIAADDYV